MEPDSPAKDPQTGGEIPRAEETLSPSTSKTTSQAPEPPSPSETKGSPSPVKAPSPQKASPTKVAPSPSAVGAPPSPKPLESPKTTPLRPQSHGLDSTGEDLSVATRLNLNRKVPLSES
jgi:hypothetical protein